MSDLFTVHYWHNFWHATVENATTRGLKLVLILVLYWLARRALFGLIDATLARRAARRLAPESDERRHRVRTLQGLVKSVVSYVLVFVAIVAALHTIDIDITGLLETAGIGGLAIGFGAQRLVRDVISGFFLIIEDQFAVGEYVTLGGPAGTVAGPGISGIVDEIGMRVTRVRDEQGRLWTIANGDITAVINPSRAPVESSIEVSIAAGADVQAAERVIHEAGRALMATDVAAAEGPSRLQAPPAVQGVAAFDGTKTTLRVSVVTDPRVLSAEQLRVREAIRSRLAQAGIPLA